MNRPRYGMVGLLSCLLVAWLLAGPAAYGIQLVGATTIAAITSVVGLRASREHRGSALGVVLLATAIAIVTAVTFVYRPSIAELIGTAWMLIVGMVLPVVIGRALARRRKLDVPLLMGALSIYLLVGVAFTMAYALTAALQAGPMLQSASGPIDGTLRDHVYFSFVTMSTTGYGDLAPINGTARALAILEALGGQLYLVTAVAAIVSLLAGQMSTSQPSTDV